MSKRSGFGPESLPGNSSAAPAEVPCLARASLLNRQGRADEKASLKNYQSLRPPHIGIPAQDEVLACFALSVKRAVYGLTSHSVPPTTQTRK